MKIDKNEVRRLEKAAREKDKRKLLDWAVQFEGQIRNELDKQYDDNYGVCYGCGEMIGQSNIMNNAL